MYFEKVGLKSGVRVMLACLCVFTQPGLKRSPLQVRKCFDTERVSCSDRAQVTDMHYACERKGRLDIKRTLRYSQ